MRTLAVLLVLLIAGSGAAAFYSGAKILGQQAPTWGSSPPATTPAALPPSVVTVTQAVPPDSIPAGGDVAPPVLPAVRSSASPPVATTAPAPATPVAAGQPAPPAPAAPQQTPAPIADLGVLGLIGVTVGGL